VYLEKYVFCKLTLAFKAWCTSYLGIGGDGKVKRKSNYKESGEINY
jgi:hypothetical protein